MDDLACDCGGCDGCGDCGDCCGPNDCNGCCGPSDCGCCDFLFGMCVGGLCCGSCDPNNKNRPDTCSIITTVLITLLVLSLAGWFIFRNKEETPKTAKVEEVQKAEKEPDTKEEKSVWKKTKSVIHELTR